MFDLNRRRFLQSTSLVLAGGYAGRLFGDDAIAPPTFTATPSFEPTALFLTWQRDPTTSMTVQWVGDEKDAAERPLYFAPTGGDQWRTQAHTSRPFPMTDKWLFRAELTGLTPDTDFRFRVGLDSAEQRFRTMPAKATNAIQFVSGGDAGVGSHTTATNHVAALQAPQFVVLGGDIAYENGRAPAVFLEFLKGYSRDLRDHQQRLVPLLGCLGNHEVNGGYHKTRNEAPFFYSIFDGLFPETGYNCLDFGDYMSLIFLDTDHTSPIGGEQTDWLARTLKEREECPTVFVFNHVPAYPSVRPFGGQDSESGTGAGNRKHWVPLFERYNVDAVFEHHDHAYKRTHPLADGLANDKGVLYLGDGSWGKIRTPATPVQRPYLAVTDEAYHLSVHRIEGHQRAHVALADNGRVVDVCLTTKRSHLRTS
ncbi:MAG: purple acid phosphatase family protein [Pirellulales bacterium]